MKEQKPLTPEENRIANILCMISIACEVVPVLLERLMGMSFMHSLQNTSDYAATAVTTIMSIVSGLGGLAVIAGIVLVIVVRVKYPANLFGKILMWVYIVLFIMALLVVAVVIIACGIACNSLGGDFFQICSDCGRIG